MSRGLQILVFGVIAVAQAVVILFAVPLVEMHGAFHQGAADGSTPSSAQARAGIPAASAAGTGGRQ